MKRVHTDVKYPDDYEVRPGDVVEIIAPNKERVGVYVAMNAYKGNGSACSMCVLSHKKTGNPCPMPLTGSGWRLCTMTYVFFKPVEAVLEDL